MIRQYPRGKPHSEEALRRCNAVSCIAYEMALGKRAFYTHDKQGRQALREIAKVRYEREQRYGFVDELEAKALDGFVYLITHDHRPGLVKIGHARDPVRRLAVANTWCPDRAFRLIGGFYFADRQAAEAEMHKRLTHRARWGEWFEISNELAFSHLKEIHEKETGSQADHPA